MDYGGIFVICPGLASLLWMVINKLYCLFVGSMPAFLANSIQRFHCPLNDMEGVDTALTVRREFIDTLRDPAGTVTGDNLYTGQLLIGKSLVELLQNGFSMTVANPYDSVGIVVHNNSDVLVAFAVAGLIDADVNQPIQTLCMLRFEIVKAPGNAAAYCLSVDTHVVCHGASGQIFGQPGNS